MVAVVDGCGSPRKDQVHAANRATCVDRADCIHGMMITMMIITMMIIMRTRRMWIPPPPTTRERAFEPFLDPDIVVAE